ncbi:MAG TPA: hypothetical protein VFR06_07190 [Gallionellaceae bacterium]|nr:hypothetical protein [Gallionellaceae bacterium]
MKKLISLFALLAAGTFSALASAEEASVKFLSPVEGAKLDAMAVNKVSYEVAPGSKGDHVHFYVDGKEAAVLRQLKGSYTLETLGPGKHELCIKIVNKGHTPIGVQQCINVTAE